MMDRTPQYKPVNDLLAQMQAAQEASDAANALASSNAAAIVAEQQKVNALYQKVQPWGGGTAADFGNYGQAWADLQKLQSANGPLLADATNKTFTFHGLFAQLGPLSQALLVNPGAVEQV